MKYGLQGLFGAFFGVSPTIRDYYFI